MQQINTSTHISAAESSGLSSVVRDEGEQYVTYLAGELDIAGCPRLRRELRELRVQTRKAIVLDLSALDFIDSSGVALLLELTAHAGYGEPSSVVLRRGPESVQQVLRTAGVELKLPFVD